MARRTVRHRSAISGRFVRGSTAKRHPRTTIKDAMGGSGKRSAVHRSAISGRFISKAAAKRHPKTSVRETIRR